MPPLTAAAHRILTVATQLAESRQGSAIDLADLLLAVLQDGSRGAELLGRFELDESAPGPIGDLIDEGFENVPLAVNLRFSATDGWSTALPHSKQFTAALEAAHDAVRQAGRGSELGSEHLVLGLTVAETPAKRYLARYGVTLEALRPFFETETTAVVEAVPTDMVLDPSAGNADRNRLLRAIDAAANRAAEGLRVAEDYARFVQDDRTLTRIFKQLRHRIVEILSVLPLDDRLKNRETIGDVGATLASPSAESRQLPQELLTANLHRAQEALRSLEEFGQLVEPTLGPPLAALRYELYTLEKNLAGVSAANIRLRGRSLYVLLTQAACRLPVEEVIRGAAAGGAGVFQVREKSLSDRDLLHYLHRVRRWTEAVGSLLIVNDRPDLAVLCNADGVHVGQEELSPREARQIVGPDRLVGVSTHDSEQARAALREGADYLGVGPTFASTTKGFETYAGLEFVRAMGEEMTLPWFAIGGINESNIAEVHAAGASRVAVSAAVCGSDDPRNAAAALTYQLSQPIPATD